jgi:hypothetical protein
LLARGGSMAQRDVRQAQEADAATRGHIQSAAGTSTAADRLINTFDRAFPAAVACFRDDLDALLAIHRSRSGTVSEYGPRTWPNARSSKNAAAPRSSADSATNARR